MGSNAGFHARSKSKTNYQHALKTQAHIDCGVVLSECILRPLAIARKSNQTNPILDPVKSPKKSLALKRLAFSKKFSIEQDAKKPIDLHMSTSCAIIARKQERWRRSHRKFALEQTANHKENSSSKKAS
jgi:hypothetical protein